MILPIVHKNYILSFMHIITVFFYNVSGSFHHYMNDVGFYYIGVISGILSIWYCMWDNYKNKVSQTLKMFLE